MFTTDFSRAPVQGRADAMVVVERAGGSREWQATVQAATRRAPGHLWSRSVRVGRGPGSVRAVLGYFRTRADVDAFLEAALYLAPARVRVLEAQERGYSNGVWRAEGPVMEINDRFAPLDRETRKGRTPPLVVGERGPAASSDEPNARSALRFYRERALAVLRPKRHGAGAGAGAGTGAGVPLGDPDEPLRTPADGGATFIGATRYRGLHSWAIQSQEWFPMVAKMQRMPGFVWHTIYWQAPFTLGTLAFFDTYDDLLAFARFPEHRRLMEWIVRGTRNGNGGFIRIHLADGPPRELGTPEVVASDDDATVRDGVDAPDGTDE